MEGGWEGERGIQVEKDQDIMQRESKKAKRRKVKEGITIAP